MAKEKSVLLFSGGLDSTLYACILLPDTLLYVDMKTSYSEIEMVALESLPQSIKKDLQVKQLPMGEFEDQESLYLPYRNLMLATVGLHYGQKVYLGFTAYDNAPDKDVEFLKKTNILFKHLNRNAVNDMGWESTNFEISAPLHSKSKTDLVEMALAQGTPKNFIQHIRSCYDSLSYKGCGICEPCMNKAVALLNNGMYEPELFDAKVTSMQLTDMAVVKRATIKNKELKEKYDSELCNAIEALRQTEE